MSDSHDAQRDTPLLGVVAANQDLVVVPVEETVREPARKRELHFLDVARSERDRPAGPGGVDRLAVVTRDVGDVFGRLEPPFDLQAGDPQLDQLRDQVVGGQVLWAQKILDVVKVDAPAVADDLIRHAAGLGALAPIRRAASQGLAGEALSRIGDAERTVNEHFDRKVDRPADPADLSQCQLACQDDPRATELAGERDPFLARDRHLGRRVDLEVGRDRVDQPGQSQVLHDDRVDAGRGQVADRALQGRSARRETPAY